MPRLRNQPDVTLTDLRADITRARNRGDLDAAKEGEHKLLLALGLTVRAGRLRTLVVRAANTIGNVLLNEPLASTTPAIRAVLLDLVRTVAVFFQGELHQVAIDAQENVVEDFVAVATLPQLRKQTGLAVTDARMPKPQGVLAPAVESELATRRDSLLAASSMLVLSNDNLQEQLSPVSTFVRPPSSPGVAASVDAFAPAVSRPWRSKLAILGSRLFAIPGSVHQGRQLEEGITEILKKRVQAPMGILSGPTAPGGYYAGVLQELQHETLRVRGLAEDQAADGMDTVVGYSLHSRFLRNTAPDHAARDGRQFYKDDRGGSRLPWARRIIPPYRKNCVCFTVPLLEDPAEDVYSAEFGLRYSRGEYISIRDVGTWQEWFAAQRAGVQKAIVGKERWFAVQSHALGGRPKWSDFVSTDGRVMSARALANESLGRYQFRRARMERVIDEQSRLNRAGWARGQGQFRADPAREREYRRRLEAFLKRVAA